MSCHRRCRSREDRSGGGRGGRRRAEEVTESSTNAAEKAAVELKVGPLYLPMN